MNKVEEGVNGRRGEAVDTVEIDMDGEDTTYCGSCISTVIFIFSAILIVCTFPFSLCVCIKMVQVWNYSFSQTFTRPVDQKAVTHLIFSLERTDFENVIFEKIPWAPSEVAKVKKWPWNPKQWKLLGNRWYPKFGLWNLEHGILTSRTSEWAQWILPKNTFFKSGKSIEKNEE